MIDLSWYAIIITQIIAESLPISSSGHVALMGKIIGFSSYENACVLSASSSWITEQLRARSIDYFLHGPTFCIVGLFFYRRWIALLKCWRKTLFVILQLILYIGVADGITLLFFIARRQIPFFTIPLGLGFVITGLALASLAWCTRKGGKLNLSSAVILGMVQGCALLLPGVSRFGTTYAAARWLSLSDRHAFEVSWMIQMPLMGISFLYSLIIFWQNEIPVQILNPYTAFVMMGATIGGWYALRFAAYVSNCHKMWWFACYMILPLAVWVFLLGR